VFDLDPGPGADVLTCSRVAFLLRDLLEDFGLRSFVKVSGSKGLQIYAPLNTEVTYQLTQPFAKATAELLSQQHPKLVVADMAKALRNRKVFIDWSHNSDFKTTVGVYSLRAKTDRPFVSLPSRGRSSKLQSRKTMPPIFTLVSTSRPIESRSEETSSSRFCP
jgi:bifunctional non-homologous end joining protein LigD